MSEEWFDLVDEAGQRIGKAPRSACHGDPNLLHQAVHVFVFNGQGELFLQKRSTRKDVQPGKWDTPVGGHVGLGEDAADAARREMAEELGIAQGEPLFLYHYFWRSPVESELIRSFRLTCEGPFALQAEEIDEGRFWSVADIEQSLGQGMFTPNFEFEWPRLRQALA